MEPSKEYHDPDYPEASASVKQDVTGPSEAEKVRKIRAIVRREFSKEIEDREQEIKTIDQRASTARQLLHRLRCVLVTRCYQQHQLQLSGSQVQDEVAAQTEPRVKAETSSLLRDGQRRLHPSVRKLVGKKTVDIDEIFRHRSPRKKNRPDYNAMLHTRNYTIMADKTTSLRPERPEASVDPEAPSRPKRIPRQMDPKNENVLKLNEVTRNRQKHRFRIIIGNTSKYAPAASVSDASTHKWLLYVRHADVTSVTHGTDVTHDLTDVTESRDAVVTGVSVELHHSYAPHHKVHVDKPPYHVSRRGWGEFPAKVTLQFALPERNKPATIEHTIKLDRNYTGLQTLGAETIVDVWLYSTEEMLKYEFKDEIEPPIDNTDITPKTEEDTASRLYETPLEGVDNTDSWLDFFKNDTSELDVDEMIIKSVKSEDDLDAMINSNVIKKEPPVNAAIEDFDLSLVKEEVYDGVDATETQIGLGNVNIPKDSVETPKKKIMKYMDPITGKIYYLEMDRTLDLSKVQEIVINSRSYTQTAQVSPVKANGLSERKPTKKGVSLLKPELSNQLKNEKKVKRLIKVKTRFKHIQNDHCYLGEVFTQSFFSNEDTELPVAKKKDSVAINVTKEVDVYDELIVSVKRFDCVRVAVNYLLSKIPLVSQVRKSRHFPFVVENDDVYWKLDFAKRRNIEWSRAKLINKILTQHTKLKSIWRTKQILLFSRLHGYYPIRKQNDIIDQDWSIYDDIRRKDHRLNIPSSLTMFNIKDYPLKTDSVVDLTSGEEVIDVVCDSPVKVKREMLPEQNNYLQVLPVEDEEDRLRFMFIERKCADIGIELRNEDVGSGYSYSAVHAVILSAVKSYAEEVIRSALAAKLTGDRTSSDPPMTVWTGSSVVSVCTSSVLAALRGSARLEHAGSTGLATCRTADTTQKL